MSHNSRIFPKFSDDLHFSFLCFPTPKSWKCKSDPNTMILFRWLRFLTFWSPKTWKKEKKIVWKFHKNSTIFGNIVDFIFGVFAIRQLSEIDIFPHKNGFLSKAANIGLFLARTLDFLECLKYRFRTCFWRQMPRKWNVWHLPKF